MTCQERQDQLLLLAFGQLDAKEDQELREHIAGGCPVCAGALAESQALAAMVPLALKPETPDAGIKKRLMEEVHQDEQRQALKIDVAAAQIQQRNKHAWLMPAAIAAAVAVVVTGMLAYVGPVRHLQAKNVAVTQERDQARSKADENDAKAKNAEADRDTARADAKSSQDREKDARGQLTQIQTQLATAGDRVNAALSQAQAARDELEKTKTALTASDNDKTTAQTQLTQLTQQVQKMDQLIGSLQDKVQKASQEADFVKAPGLELVNLQTKNQPTASGHILYDPTSNRWLMVANGMQNPGAGRTYELWIITNKAIAGGTFNVDAAGQGTLIVNLPAGAHVTQAAVTDEPAGGTQQPTGTMQLAGNVTPS